jgi:prophage regulatory protein
MDTEQMRLPDGTNERDSTSSPQLLVSAKQAARMCSKSLRTWRAWDAAGWIPRPVRIGRSTLWRTEELRAWIEAGCPRREEWEARQ